MGQPSSQALPHLLEELELHRLLGLLTDGCAMPGGGVHNELVDAQPYEVAAPQLAVDGEVEQRQVPDPDLR